MLMISIAAGSATNAAGSAPASTPYDPVIVDNTPPTVTINQAADQADPASTCPIHFTAVFREPVFDFNAWRVTLSTGGGAAVQVHDRGDHTTFDMSVSGLSTACTVSLTIPAVAAHDAAGNPNGPSTSTDNQVKFQRSPANASLSPSAAKLTPGVKSKFAAVYTDPDGYGDLAQCCLLLGTSNSGKSAAFVMYDPVKDKLYLRNDANTAWLGGAAPGSADVIENSQCKLYCAETTKSGSGANLSITWKIEFKQAYADTMALGTTLKAYMYDTDKESLTCGWTSKGEYKWLYPVSEIPGTGKMAPGAKQTFASVYRDDDGYADISQCYALFNTTTGGAKAAYVMYDPAANKLYVSNDGGSSWGTGYAPGSSNVLENSQCKLYCADTTVASKDNLLTVNWKIEFKQPLADKVAPGATLKGWTYVVDKNKLASGWLLKGEYTWLCATSLTPNSGALTVGAKQTFASIYRDDDGYADVTACYLLFSMTPTGKNAAYTMYDPVADKLYLRNDANSAWLGGSAPGSANLIENTQCKLYCAGTTTSGTANQLTINWQIEFKQGMKDKVPPGSPLNAWMYVIDKTNMNTGWVLEGGLAFN